MRIAPIDKSKLAKSDQEYKELAASDADWIIRSVEDLNYLRENDKDGVFAKLPEPDFKAFANSLIFKQGANAGGTYKFLMPSLTLTEIFEVFEHFGMAREYFSETLEEKCTAAGCKFSFWDYCSSALC
ncbi:hypothetical protein [Nonomuraea roseola]|uniref:Uncharacterized protein n=1 Tax=Nonomuraea roseola TaxID=46179 RepID=A0ABV5PVV4_9ACTN